ncbi:MAG: hypothetical protein ABFE07_17325 [Armatimonadia bacterium]
MNEPNVNPHPASAPRLPLLVAVFCTALSVLAFEVALSRAFSVLLRYHFVFLAISLATSGIGLGGLLDYLTDRWFHRTLTPLTHLSLRAALLAALYPLTIYLLFATPLAAHLTSVWVVSGLCILPFLVAGSLLSRIFAEHSQAGGTLYFADLVGAALGSFLVIAALQALGATNVPFVCGMLAALAAVGLAYSGRATTPARALSVILWPALLALLLANAHGKYLDLPVMPVRDDPAAKPLYQELGDPRIGAKIVYSEWNAFARTDVVSNARANGTTDPKDDLYIYTDGEVPTNMLWYPGKMAPLGSRLRSFIGFPAFEWFRPEKALLIGPGGGLDILLAAAVGTRQIDGVELNPSIPRIVRKFGDFNGHLYDRQNVRIFVDEGRSFVRRSPDQYDLIYMALTKTATTASNSLALVEGYIYTREAFEDYLAHLTPNGKVALVFQEPSLLLRTMLTALEALERDGKSRQEALDCVMAISMPEAFQGLGPYRHLLVISKSPFSPAESQKCASQTIALGFDPAYFPGAFEPVPFSWLTQKNATTPQFIQAWNDWMFGAQHLNIYPRTDDQPFVVDMTFHMPGQFWWLLVGALALGAIFSVVAISQQRSGGATVGLGAAVVYFACLGVGFMVVEISLIQKLVLYLGYPVLSLSVILFSLLLGGGSGSLLSQRWGTDRARWVAGYAALAVVLYGLALQYGSHPIIAATLGLDIRVRSLITMVLLLPLGFALGMPFPTGLRAIGSRAERFVPWMWGVNGLLSVVGSVGAMIMAKFWGFSTTLLAGWGIYALVAALCLTGVVFRRK